MTTQCESHCRPFGFAAPRSRQAPVKSHLALKFPGWVQVRSIPSVLQAAVQFPKADELTIEYSEAPNIIHTFGNTIFFHGKLIDDAYLETFSQCSAESGDHRRT